MQLQKNMTETGCVMALGNHSFYSGLLILKNTEYSKLPGSIEYSSFWLIAPNSYLRV